MSAKIHSSSVISAEAIIDPQVEIGPFCVVEGKVKLGAGTVIESHVRIGNPFATVEMGENNRISAGSAIGGFPQDLKYNNEPTRLTIGDHNIFREYVTINTGTVGGGGVTRLGDHNLIMAYCHIAHDCLIGNHVVIANSGQLAGHVRIDDHAKIGGVCCISQFLRIGSHAYIAGDSAINKDILPFTIAQGRYAVSRATNKIGLERLGVTKSEVENIHRAIRIILKGSATLEEALVQIQHECEQDSYMQYLTEFIQTSEKGIAK